MKNKINLRKLIFILIGMFFCVIPIEAKAAADYKVSFKFYKIDSSYTSTSNWLKDFKKGTYQQLTDLSSLSPGDVVAVVPDFEFVGTNATAEAVSIYFRFDKDTFQLTTLKPNKYLDLTSVETDPDAIFQHNYDDDDTTWTRDKFEVDESNGTVSLVFRDSYMNQYPFDYKGDRKVAFVYFEVKEGGDPGKAAFTFATDKDPIIDTSGESATGKFVTMAAGNDENFKEFPIDLDTEDYIPEVKLSDDVTLKTLTVMNGSTNYTLDPAFIAGSTTTTYTLNVPYSVKSIDLQATPTHKNATILTTELGTKNLSVGDNNLEFTVTPEDPDASVQIYSIKIRRQNNVATLNTLTVDGIAVTGFVSDSDSVLTFTLEPVSASSIVIAATPTDSNAKIANGALGTKNLSVGDNSFDIDVTSEDGTVTKKYTINVKRKSNIATLSGLSITSDPQGTMNPASFGSGTKSYTYTYDETVTSVSISVTATNSNAMVQIGSATATKGSATGSITPTDGGTVDITTTAEDGTTHDSYTISFARKKSTVNTLSSLSIKDSANKEYITSFNSVTNSYSITVENDITSLNVSATATSPNARVGSRTNSDNTYTATINNLGFSSNVHTITVYPEETTGTNGIYTINITRKQSDNANLTDLKVDSTSLTGFNGTQNGTYNLNDVDSIKSSVTISYTKENNEASVAITNNGTNVTGNTVNLVEGNNVIVVAVTSQDGTKTISHTINIKKKSSVATLSGLSITSNPHGTMDPATFATGTKTYKYIYDETVGNVTINATATNSAADVKIGTEVATKGSATSNSINPKTTTSIDIVVTAEDGHSTDTYTITFERAKSTVNTLSTLSVKDSSNNEYITGSNSFSESKKTYNITVPHDVTSLNISATATSGAAKINNGTNTYTGTMDNLNFTSNSLVLTVSPEQGSDETYTINVTRTKSDNAYLTDLRVGSTTVNGFNKLDDSTPFDIGSVANSVTSLNISYDKENQYSVDVVNGNSLSVGDNTVTVKITSQDGTKTMEYKIKVRRKSIDVGFADLRVVSTPQGTLTGPDASNIYTFTYDRSVTSVDIQAIANSGKPVVGAGTHSIASGDATLTVTPEDETASVGVYTIKFVQELETDSSLTGLSVAEENGTPVSLDKIFSSTDLSYSLTVDPDVDKVNVSAILSGSHAKNISIDGKDNSSPTGTITNEVSLNPGSNVIQVIVTAEDNTSTTYTLNITRTINTSAALTDLRVDGTQVPDFSSSKTIYNLNSVSYVTDSANVTFVAASGATVTGTINGTALAINNNNSASVSLDVGDNAIVLTVTSQDGANHISYTVNIRRKSNIGKITSLTSSAGTTLHNGATEFAYTLDIPSGTTNVSLTPTFATGATLRSPGSLENIDVTSITEIKFTVQAEDTDSQYDNEYVVTLNKLASTNNNLASLSVDKGTLTPNFAKETTEYTVTVGTNDDKINVNATVEDTGKANIVSDLGEHTLNYGDNEIIVKVEAENGNTKEYKITVTRPKNNDTSLKTLTIDGNSILEANKDTYNISLPFGTTSFELNAEPTDSNANIVDSATKLGTMNLTGNTGTFTFEVEAQDGTKKTYTINATVSANNDTTIGSLTVLGKTPTWNPTNNRYELTVDGETLKVGPDDVTATFTNGASITNKDPEMNLVLGANSYKFEVTAADGTTKEYEVLITREASTINTLDTLTSSTGTFEPVFDKDTNIYKLIVPDGTTDFTISATATSKNPATTIIGTGDYTMPIATNPISISVRSEDGTVNIYEITVEYATAPGLDKIVAKATGVYTTDDNYVLGVRNKTSFDDVFKSQFDNEPTELVLYLKDGITKVTTDTIGTGMILKLERNGVVLDQKTIVVLGDTSGDGEITVYDAVIVVNHFLKTELLDGAYLKAADTSKDDSITVYDAVIITNHFLKTLNIYE